MGAGCCCKYSEAERTVKIEPDQLLITNRFQSDLELDTGAMGIETQRVLFNQYKFFKIINTEASHMQITELSQNTLREEQSNKKIVDVTNLECSDGVYTGQMIEDKRNGKGKLVMKEAIVYSGSWKDNKPNGEGYLKYSEDHFYEGEFRKGLFHGFGTYYKLGSFYKGFWRKGLKHGEGTEEIDDFVYKGNFKKGKKHGFGVMNSNKGVFEGTFHKGYFIEGTFTTNMGIVTKGKWSDGKLVDCVIYSKDSYYSNIELSEGLEKGKIHLIDGKEIPINILESSTKRQMIISP
ncbi:hypothetical protein SteCoe_24290 [Stentor coeruleus]|uniref:MORN repeat protein n=1 Tax=Stentor coeruleus TaxID=5963 RepID=A0A1R2BHW5_9CILI|nr:hypothetical protein SteCoe_24290 [Stentor coeruleus]